MRNHLTDPTERPLRILLLISLLCFSPMVGKAQSLIRYSVDLGVEHSLEGASLSSFANIERYSTGYSLRYEAGKFKSYIEALEHKLYAIEKGFRTAHIVAYVRGQKMPVQKALHIQDVRHWKAAHASDVLATHNETCKSLRYKVMLGDCRAAECLQNYLSLETIEAHSSGRTIYFTFGEVNTLEEAKMLESEVLAAGIEGAKVIALIDGEEVALEEAQALEAMQYSVAQHADTLGGE